MPRVLEDMFWVGRYAERAEDLLRLMLAAHVLVEDYRTRPRTSGGLSLEVMTEPGGPAGRARRRADYDEDFRSLLLDPERPGSVAQSLEAMRDALVRRARPVVVGRVADLRRRRPRRRRP